VEGRHCRGGHHHGAHVAWRHVRAVAGRHVAGRHGQRVVRRIKGGAILHVDGVLQHVIVEQELKGASADRRELAQHDVLAHARHPVRLSKDGGAEQDVHRLLKGAAHERAGVIAVDPMAGDGHEEAAVRHDVGEDGQVAVVHVRAVKLNHTTHLAEKLVAGRLHAQHLNHLRNVVAHGASEVHVGMAQNLSQVDALRVQDPLRDLGVAALAAHDLVSLSDEHLFDHLDPLQLQLRQHVGLNLPHKHVLLALILHALLRGVVHDPDAQDLLGRVIVAEDAVKVILKFSVHTLCHLAQQQPLVHHHLTVCLDAQQPGAHALRVEVIVRHLEVGLHRLAVLLDDAVLGIGVVVNFRGRRHRGERGVFQRALHALGVVAVSSILAEKDGQGRRFDVLCDVDDLRQTRDAQSDVLATHTSKMEGVQRHLRGGLPDGLRCQRANHLAGVRHRLQELGLDLTQHPVKGLLCQAVLAQHALRVQRGPQHVEEGERGVALRLHAQRVLPVHHHQLLRQLLHLLDHVQWAQPAAGVFALPDAKHHLRIPDEACKVDGKEHRVVSARDKRCAHPPELLLQSLILRVNELPCLQVGPQLLQHLLLQPVRLPARLI